MIKGKLKQLVYYGKHYKLFLQKHSKYIQTAVIIFMILAALMFFVLNGEKSPDNKTHNSETSISSLKQKENKAEAASKKKNKKTNKVIECKLTVDISGEIAKPGVYQVNKGTRIYQLIEQAGGLSQEANIDIINRAAPVQDGQKIVIPSKQNIPTQQNNSSETNYEMENAGKPLVNINQASKEELENISGIGPAMAKRIIEHRRQSGNFASIDEIKKVKGIGEKKFDKIKAYITI